MINEILRSHRAGKYNPKRKSRDIIVKFTSNRGRARLNGNKRNLKSYKRNQSKQKGPIFVNESLTSRWPELYVKTHQLVKAKQVNRCWTYDERICVKLCGLHGKKMVIGTLEDLDKSQDDDGIKEMEQRFALTPL